MIPLLFLESTRSVCPGITGPAWEECAANLSYEQIQKVCDGLGPKTREGVDQMFRLPGVEVYGNHPDVTWQGCMYNEVTGVHREAYTWNWDGEHYIMRDVPRTYCVATVGESVSAFDDITTTASGACSGHFTSSLLAYLLQPLSRTGFWVARTAKNNLTSINEKLAQRYNADPIFVSMPTLFVQAVSPTLLVVKTADTENVCTSGVFFRSVTGYTYGLH